ncbi:MAG: O-antigen ligase family protein, partial [Bdellovibrionales bacterium]|nr:O-antigen ligase family protein [Bdellovibrionales bacterium]
MLFFLVSLFITCSLGLLSSLQELVFVAVILLLFLYNRFWRNSPSSIWMVTGGIVPFSSFFGPNALLLVLALRFLFIPKSELLEPLSRLRPLAYLLLTWFLAECCFRADWLLYQDLLFQDPDSLLQWWKLVPPLFLQTAWTSYRLFLFFLLLLFFVSHRDVREVVLKGLLWGTAPAILIACGEHVWGESGLFVQHNEFWKLVGRYSGSFQDPNAFGVSAALLMALWLSTKGEVARPLVLVTCLTLFVLALFSGSRTFFIFLVVFAFFFLYEVSRKTTLRALLGLVILFVAILASYFLIPGFSQALPVGAQRLLRSFDPAHLWTSLGSRVIFSRIAFFMWKDAPLFGIGPNHFKQLAIPYGERVGYPLGIWTDNPNNFYLDLLVQF